MPTLIESDKCCGCAACASKCAKKAISMKPNKEGFLHPSVDTSKCVECGLCEKVCPGIHPAINKGNNGIPEVYVVQHKNDKIRYQSTSGGAFTAIAEEIIRRDGVVFGASMSADLSVRHCFVEKEEELVRFRNSKYVQSTIGNSYQLARKFLLENRYVCFSGTPCQINGLYKYLGKDYEKLIAVDVVCKSVPSPLIFSKYVEFKKQQEKTITDIVFRDKKRGFLYCTMAHYRSHEDRLKNRELYRRGSESDEWLRLFLSGKISRHSCMTCQYQTRQRVGDFTLGDIWETGFSDFDDNKGSTLVHVWTKKGQRFLEDISSNITCVVYPNEKSRGMERYGKINIWQDRDQLFEDAQVLPVEAFFAKYAPYNIKVRIKNYTRVILWGLQLQALVRRIKHSIIHRK